MPIGLIAMSVGIVGLIVLLGDIVMTRLQLFHPRLMLMFMPAADTDKKLALSHTAFAILWRKAVHHNPFTQAFMLNFGAIGRW